MFFDIPDFPGYKIDVYGNIMSFKRYKDSRKRRPYIDKDGYVCTNLRKNNQAFGLKVHRLVAKVFIPNPENLPQVNHKNGIKTDNHADNLEWCSNIDNQRHAWDTNLKTGKLTRFDVLEVRRLISLGLTNKQIHDQLHIEASIISRIRSNHVWSRVK